MRHVLIVGAAALGMFAPGMASAALYKIDVVQNLDDWYINPGYGNSVISAPWVGAGAQPALQAGDDLQFNISFQPGQKLILRDTGGSWAEQILLQGFSSNNSGVGGTYSVSVGNGLAGGTGNLNGSNFMFASQSLSLAGTEIGFNTFTFDVHVTNPSSFTLSSYFFQVYGDYVAKGSGAPDVPAAAVPEPAVVTLFGAGAIALGVSRRRKRSKRHVSPA